MEVRPAATFHPSIQPAQQFRYIAGKNATDSAMIIDAKDSLCRHEIVASVLSA
jgi:hypothetical protein